MEKTQLDGFELRKEQSKESIRHAVLALFSQFGVEKVSIADIARKAGVSQATIYNHFGSKDALTREFVAIVVGQLVTGARDVLSTGSTFEEKMSGLSKFIAGNLTDERSNHLDRAVFTGSIDLQADPEISKIRETAKERLIGIIMELVEEGKAQGQINCNISDDALIIYFNAFMDVFADYRLRQKFISNPNLAQDLSSLMIFGLTK